MVGSKNNQSDIGGHDSIEGISTPSQSYRSHNPTPFESFNVRGVGPRGEEPTLKFLNYILAREDLPQVISTSYGDDEMLLRQAYAKRVCNAFVQLGARGTSVIYSSGDIGVSGSMSPCSSPDGGKQFIAHFPASCPWMTRVGAVEDLSPEVAVKVHRLQQLLCSAQYQHQTVSAYVAGVNGLHDGVFNKNGW